MAALLGRAGNAAGREDRPNVVFIFADDMGWGDLPCYGHRSLVAHGGWTVRETLHMPNLDRMAAEGTRFTQFYVNSAVCSPSRTGIMCGRFPGELGIHDYISTPELNRERGMPDAVDPANPTLTRLLNDAGYAVGHFGKWHLGSGQDAPAPESYGIDSYASCLDGPSRRPGSTEMIADETISFIREHRDRPFYINAWLYDPHAPLRPTEEHLAPYRDIGPGWDDNTNAMQVWYAVLTNMDRHIGRIMDTLDDLGLSGRTYVIFSADNGPADGLARGTSHHSGVSSTGPFRGIKRSLYEGGIRMPFIVRRHGHTPAGLVDNDTVISGVDFLPTLCREAGVSIPDVAGLDGEDMSAALGGDPVSRTRPLMWENRMPVYGPSYHKSPMLAIRDGNWKLLLNPDRGRMELYNMPDDSTELTNLADRYPAVAERLAGEVLAWRDTLPAGPVHQDAGANNYPWPRHD